MRYRYIQAAIRSVLLPLNKHQKIAIGLALLIALLLVFDSVQQARYAINSDAVSYMAIAQDYARGNWRAGVNGYWSPLAIWLITPFIALGIMPTLAFAAVSGLAAATLIIVGAYTVLSITKKVYLCLLYIVIATLFSRHNIYNVSPDLLLAAWSTVFILAFVRTDSLVSKDIKPKQQYLLGALLGVIGAVGYLIKLYALPFFVATILLWALIRVLLIKNKNTNKATHIKKQIIVPIAALVSCGIVMSPWVAVLTVKYGYPVVGSAATVNTRKEFLDPELQRSVGRSVSRESSPSDSGNVEGSVEPKEKPITISQPPHPTAVSTTQDRTPDRPERNYMQAREDGALSNFIKARYMYVPGYLKKLIISWPSLALSIVIVILTIIRLRLGYRKYNYLYLLTVSAVVYIGGFALIVGGTGGNLRYYLPAYIFGILLSMCIASVLWDNKRYHYRIIAAIVLVVAVVTAYIAYPLQGLFQQPTVPPLMAAANDFSSRIEPAYFDDYLSNNGRQNREFAFYVNGQAYGSLGAGYNIADIRVMKAMERYGIDYFLHFEPSNNPLPSTIDQHTTTVARYDLGKNYTFCEDVRDASYTGSCKLYILQLE